MPQIIINLSEKIIDSIIKFFFAVGVLGLLLSALVIENGFASTIIYNVSAGVIMTAVGFKIIFLDK